MSAEEISGVQMVAAVRTSQVARVAARVIHERRYHDHDGCPHPDGCEDDTAAGDGWAIAIALADIGLLAIPFDPTP